MLTFNEGACQVLAEDTRSSLADVDKALGTQARMMTTMVETFAGTALPARRAQRMYGRLHAAMGQVLQGRCEVVELVAELQATQRRSNVAEVGFGCSSPWDDIFAGSTGLSDAHAEASDRQVAD